MIMQSRRAVMATGFMLLGTASNRAAASPPAGARDVREFGAVGDGIADDTAALTKAHASGQPLFYPRAKAFYRISTPLLVNADLTGDRAEFRTHQDGNFQTTFFNVLKNDKPLTISGFVLDGLHQVSDLNEHSHGIVLQAATDVTIEKCVIRNVDGDCVYLVTDKQRTAVPRNIVIRDCELSHPNRCIVAVTSGENVTIQRNRVSKWGGFPVAIDLEPNADSLSYVSNVKVLDNTFDVEGYFVNVTKSNSKPTSGVTVARNKGAARWFMRVNPTAGLSNVDVFDNEFRANKADGLMFMWNAVHDARVSRNRDRTPDSLAGYKSLQMKASDVTMSNNRFKNAPP